MGVYETTGIVIRKCHGVCTVSSDTSKNSLLNVV